MPWTDAFIPHEEIFRAQVMSATWGHLAPEQRRTYRGFIIFAHGAYGDIVPIQCEFQGLKDSPWCFDDMTEYVGDYIMAHDAPGTVYRFDGTYRKFRNGNCQFTGTIKTILQGES